mgnify:CR=1 FL=1
MKQTIKASTLAETLIASVIIMISFSCILLLFGSLMRKFDLGRSYIDMKHSRDSIVTAVSENGIYGKITIIKKWGKMNVAPLYDNKGLTEIEIESEMLNGQKYRQIYLIQNNNEGQWI